MVMGVDDMLCILLLRSPAFGAQSLLLRKSRAIR
jgi:hypothetical protein